MVLYRVRTAVTDLRREPCLHNGAYCLDRLQETQLLSGERVELLEVAEGWSKVAALDQLRWSSKEFRPYVGWILSSTLAECQSDYPWVCITDYIVDTHGVLSVGMYVELLESCDDVWKVRTVSGSMYSIPPQVPAQPVSLARCWLGSPYHWGGCSAFQKESLPLRGVDCSALIHLSYRAAGTCLPRDAHDQYLATPAIEARSLQAGDLIFMSPLGASGRIDHVMLALDKSHAIEATVASQSVRITEIASRTRGYDVAYGRPYPASGQNQGQSNTCIHQGFVGEGQSRLKLHRRDECRV